MVNIRKKRTIQVFLLRIIITTLAKNLHLLAAVAFFRRCRLQRTSRHWGCFQEGFRELGIHLACTLGSRTSSSFDLLRRFTEAGHLN